MKAEFQLSGEGPCISAGRSLWRAEDWRKEHGGNMPFFPVASFEEAWRWNEEKWGIYWTINEIDGAKKNENLRRIISWAVDFDEGDKRSQMRTIAKFGLQPSLVIESKRGFQVYFDAIGGTAANFNKIIDALAKTFRSDANIKGVARVLRAPFMLHWKNPVDPFLVRVESFSDARYEEDFILKFLRCETKPEDPPPVRPKKTALTAPERRAAASGGLGLRLDKVDCVEGLRRLSGTSAVNGERYEFKRQGNGKTSVLVNGKSANVWVDADGRIGSGDHGGPTIYQWLKWFGNDHEAIMETLRERFADYGF